MPEKFNFELPPTTPREDDSNAEKNLNSVETEVIDEYSDEKVNNIGLEPGELQRLLSDYLRDNDEVLPPDAKEKLNNIINSHKD